MTIEEIKAYARENYIPILLDETLNFISIILKVLKPKKILEIGTAIGYSSMMFSKFLDTDGRIDTIEIDKERIDMAWENINNFDLSDKIRILEGDAGEIIKYLNDSYDFIFLDGPKGQYKEYLDDCVRLLSDKGILIADNVLYRGKVEGDQDIKRKHRTFVVNLREYINILMSRKDLVSSLVDIGDGLTISTKKGNMVI